MGLPRDQEKVLEGVPEDGAVGRRERDPPC